MTDDLIPGTRRCIACEAIKPDEEFYEHPAMRDGRLNRCKPCFRRLIRERRAERRDYYNEYDRKRYSENKIKRTELILDGVAKRPERNRARVHLHNAVKRGTVMKPDTCEDCSKQFPRRLIHGHHEDYTKPLDVVWLCAPCHGKRHRLQDAA